MGKDNQQDYFAARDGAGALIFKNKMWLLGGWNPSDKVNFLKICNSEIWSSTDGKEWKLENPQAPCEGRHTVDYVVFKGFMWFIGGDANQNDVWKSSDGVNWICVCENAPWGPRQYHDVAVFDGKLWVMEGYHKDGGNKKDVWYSEDGKHWTEVPDSPWPARHTASVFVYDNAMWMVCGNNMTPDVWKLIKIEKKWKQKKDGFQH